MSEVKKIKEKKKGSRLKRLKANKELRNNNCL